MSMRNSLMVSVLVAACALSGLQGCQSAPTEPTYEQAINNPFTRSNQAAATELLRRYRGLGNPVSTASTNNFSATAEQAPLIVATLVNIDRLEQSSTFGRVVSEQLSSRLTQLGENVVELKVRNSVFMKRNEGEFLLTRELREVASAHRASAVVVGTYAESSDFVYVTLKVVDVSSSMVLAAYDYTLPIDKQVRRMLGGSRH